MSKTIARRVAILCLGCPLAVLVCLGNGLPAETTEAGMSFTFTVVLKQRKCQMAIWLVNEQGSFADTVYVTKKVAHKGLGNRGGGIDDKWGGSRLSVLPVWAHQRGVDYGGGNFYPPKDRPLVDAISAATPKAGEFVWFWQPDKRLEPGKYHYFIEVNKSFDENESHDYSWYRGQPSVVWKGSLLIGNRISEGEARIVGHGHVAGMDGGINTDLSTLTSALELIDNVTAIYKPGKN